ncbi:MAG: hypothetical protein Q9182_000696 [Xanthomendoza sp. 2 TL-2023]
MSEHSSLFRPTPQRLFDLTPSSTEATTPRTPSQEPRDPAEADSDPNGLKFSDRTRSILNLTSSTLFGIYAPTDSPKDGSSTPWATGIDTPALRPNNDDTKPPVIGAYDKPQMHRRPSQPHITLRNYYLPLLSRTTLLFLFGVAHGTIVMHLHDNQKLAPVRLEGIDRYTWRYLAFWGVAGVLLGRLLPCIDIFWERTLGDLNQGSTPPAASEVADPPDGSERPKIRFESLLGADWNPAVRSIGAFVGIAFAIPGFLLSAIVGVAGTAVLLGINPSIVPAPPASSPRARASSIATNISGHELNLSVMVMSNESIAEKPSGLMLFGRFRSEPRIGKQDMSGEIRVPIGDILGDEK